MVCNKIFNTLSTIGLDERVKRYAVEKGVLTFCTKALKKYGKNKYMVKTIFTCVVNLASTPNPKPFVEAINAGLVDNMIKISKGYKDDKDISIAFATAMSNLVDGAEDLTLQKIATNDGLELILYILNLYADDLRLAKFSCTVINKLIGKYPEAIQEIVDKNGALTIVSVLRSHSKMGFFDNEISTTAKDILVKLANDCKFLF